MLHPADTTSRRKIAETLEANARPVIEAAAGRPETMVVMVVVSVMVIPAIQILPEGVAGHIDTADAGVDHGKTGGRGYSGPLVDLGAWRG
jgi:hypothetical protein